MPANLPTSMLAWHFSSSTGGLDKSLSLNSSAPIPTKANSLGPNDVLVQVLSTALNPVDYKMAENTLFRLLLYGSPATPGIDFAGRVIATGSSSTSTSTSDDNDLKPGQLVFGRLDKPTKFGTLAAYTIASRSGCVPIPPGVEARDAASIGTAGLTAYQSIVPYVKVGEKVFINGGSGGTGIFGIQVAKALRCHVVTTCSAGNAELCRELGADEVIDYRKEDVVKVLKQKGRVFDLVVDNVGEPPGLYSDAHEFMTAKGIVIQVGAHSNLSTLYEISSRLLWPGFLGGMKRRYSLCMCVNDSAHFEQLGHWMKEGKLKTVIDEEFEMGEKGAARAFQKLKTGRARGKIVVKVTD